MTELFEKDIHFKLFELEKYLLKKYKKQSKWKKIDWELYEKKFKKRFKKAMKNLTPLIRKATIGLKFYRGRGDKPTLKINQKVRLLLISQLAGKSNRMMAYMTQLFSLITGIERSYKTIERLYSDHEVEAALFNLLVLILKKKKVTKINASGDATGYGLIISKHYASYVQKLKDKAKEQKQKKKMFVYKFVLMDLKTNMYVCFGTSLISEKRAFDKAMDMLKQMDIRINSMRLDKYYSNPCYIKFFPGARIYIIPKKNAKLGHGVQWYKIMKSFVRDTFEHLNEYYKRNRSESAFGVDKKMFGWKVRQKRPDRINTALFCRCIWRNLFNL